VECLSGPMCDLSRRHAIRVRRGLALLSRQRWSLAASSNARHPAALRKFRPTLSPGYHVVIGRRPDNMTQEGLARRGPDRSVVCSNPKYRREGRPPRADASGHCRPCQRFVQHSDHGLLAPASNAVSPNK
jgi:hypothetical protein